MTQNSIASLQVAVLKYLIFPLLSQGRLTESTALDLPSHSFHHSAFCLPQSPLQPPTDFCIWQGSWCCPGASSGAGLSPRHKQLLGQSSQTSLAPPEMPQTPGMTKSITLSTVTLPISPRSSLASTAGATKV